MNILILLSAIIFYLIGRYSVISKEEEKVLTTKIKRRLKKRPSAGVLPFKTQEDFDDEASGDKALEKRWKESGFAKLIKKNNK